MGFLSIKIDGQDSRPINMEEHVFQRSHASVSDTDLPVILSKWFDFIGTGKEDRKQALVTRVEAAASHLAPEPVKTRRLKAV